MKPSASIPVVSMNTIYADHSFEIRPLPAPETQLPPLLLPHRHHYYEIVWINKGGGTYDVDLQKGNIECDHIYFVKPGQVHRFVASENTDGYVISFGNSFVNIGEYEPDLDCHKSVFELFTCTAGISITPDARNDIREVVTKLVKEFEHPGQFGTQILKRYLKIFLMYVARQAKEDRTAIVQNRNREMVHVFMNSLNHNFKENKMVADYARQLSVTPNYLNEIIKRITGYPAGYHIRQRIVLEAKRLALYSDMCMKEIAYSLEFSDSAHFSKFFKTVTGINFSEFKKGKYLQHCSVPGKPSLTGNRNTTRIIHRENMLTSSFS